MRHLKMPFSRIQPAVDGADEETVTVASRRGLLLLLQSHQIEVQVQSALVCVVRPSSGTDGGQQ